MKNKLNAFHAVLVLLLCSVVGGAQMPADFDKMWNDCSLVCNPTAQDKFFHHDDYEERMQKALEVSGILNELGMMRDNFLQTGDLKDLFPALYFNITKTEFDAILNDQMQHPVDKMIMMEKFYDAYKLNRTAFERGGVNAVERHWQPYYSRVVNLQGTRIFNNDVRLLVNDAIYAHVKYDLPRAIRETINRSEISVNELKSDFDKTNPFFDKSTSLANNDINQALFNNNKVNRGLMAIGSTIAPYVGGVTDVVDKRADAWRLGSDASKALLTGVEQPHYQHPENNKYLPESLRKGICFALTDESSYTVSGIYDTEKTACHTDIIKQTATGRMSFGAWAGWAGPNGFQYPAWAAYNYSDLGEYNHGSLLLSIGDSVVGGGTSSEKTLETDGQIRLIINDSDYSNNVGEFSVKITLSGYRLYKLSF